MIKIIPDHEGWLTQWDKNRTVLVSGLDLTEYPDAVVQFSSPNDGMDKAYVIKPYVGDDGLVHAKLPNIFLTFPGRVDVCVYRDDHTCSFGVLVVAPHEKPDDYVYEETEVLDWRTPDKKIDDVRVTIPEKLSQLDNDLYYDKVDTEPFCTIRKEDLIFDEENNEYYFVVDSVPNPIPDTFKYMVTLSASDEPQISFEGKAVKDIDYSVPENGLYRFVPESPEVPPLYFEIGGYCYDPNNSELTSDGKTYITVLSEIYDSLASAVIYCGHIKKIPEELVDGLTEQLNAVRYRFSRVQQRIDDIDPGVPIISNVTIEDDTLIIDDIRFVQANGHLAVIVPSKNALVKTVKSKNTGMSYNIATKVSAGSSATYNGLTTTGGYPILRGILVLFMVSYTRKVVVVIAPPMSQ